MFMKNLNFKIVNFVLNNFRKKKVLKFVRRFQKIESEEKKIEKFYWTT